MKKKKILLVDDEAKFTRMVRFNLERTGAYEVMEVNDSRQALAAAEQFKPDLAVLDVMMPGLDGGDVDAQFKRKPLLKNMPVLYLTAAIGQGEAGRQGYHSGGLLFLAKPITLAALVESIETTLREGAQPRHANPGEGMGASVAG